MSNYVKQQRDITPAMAQQTKEPSWGIRDTEFLIRLIMSSKIDGSDVETAAEVIRKIKDLHATIVSHKVSI